MAFWAIARAAGARVTTLHVALACLLAGSIVAGCASSNDAAKVLNPDPPGKIVSAKAE